MAVTLDDGDYAIQRRSFSHAFDIFMLLAQDSVAVAEYKLAKMCADGQLNNAQFEILIARLDPESKRGNRYAAFNLGLLHERGLGVKKAPRRAVEYYERAIQEDPRGLSEPGQHVSARRRRAAGRQERRLSAPGSRPPRQ
ncbi:MAG: hypothetical protein MO853_00995 [Candidatus Protistobacter heckmanni]|nr:hypothetical protein [Candidatus Protistobacter heckmanni]